MVQGRVFLCGATGRVMVDPEDGSPPIALHDHCRDWFYAQQMVPQAPSPSSTSRPSMVDQYFDAASAAASCSRVF